MIKAVAKKIKMSYIEEYAERMINLAWCVIVFYSLLWLTFSFEPIDTLTSIGWQSNQTSGQIIN